MISTVGTLFEEGKDFLKTNQLEKADERFDMCLCQLAEATLRGLTELEGYSICLWKSRVWTKIEQGGLLPD
jgi:hypothetical protein